MHESDDLILLSHPCSVSLHISVTKTHTSAHTFIASSGPSTAFVELKWDMCAMMSCEEGEVGRGYIEMLMSPHSGGDSWRGTEDGVMSPLISAKEKNDGGGVG